MRVVPSRSTSRTSTAAGSSTRALTTISIVSRIGELYSPFRRRTRAARGGEVRRLNVSRNPLSSSRSFRIRRRLILRSLFDQAANGVGRLGAFTNPILHTIRLEIDLGRLARWIVRPEVLEIGAIALRLLFFHYDAI